MVDLVTPQYTFSPSEGTPHLTINHEATVDLDSSTAFEGPEKLLEVWFAPGPDCLPPGVAQDGLKSVSAETWKEMLDVVNCKVLSVVESDHVDAYLLSESSMFVFSHKLILKTCGTTTLLWGLPHILEIAAAKAGYPHLQGSSVKNMTSAATPYRVFYSRKNFLFPDRQHGPHRSWRDEVNYMDKMFWGGSAYMVGKMNGDHWYLYLTSPNTDMTPPKTPDYEKPTETKVLNFPVDGASSFRQSPCSNDDETLEILMTDLEPENAKQFYLENASAVAEAKHFQKLHESRQEDTKSVLTDITNLSLSTSTAWASETADVFSSTCSDAPGFLTPASDFPEELSTEGHALGTVVAEASGLSDVYPTSRFPDARVDAYLFTPCGFSANGVIPDPTGSVAATHYFTVHVTPEPQCSYASFETNVPGKQTGRETAEVVEHVVEIFKPGRFSVTLFEAKASADETDISALSENMLDDGLRVVPKGNAIRSSRMEGIKGYRRAERIVHELDGYDLVFRYFERNDWKGGAPRVGEIL